MPKEEDIRFLESAYSQFSEEVKSKVKNFWDGLYNTFFKDVGDQAWLNRDFVKKNIEGIQHFYAFISLIDDIYHLDFIKHICRIAKTYGFEFHRPIIEEYGRRARAMLALDLALNFPLWGRETYTNHEFQTLGFRRQVPMEGASVTEVGVVKILRVDVDESNNLRTIEPADWKVIRVYLGTVFKE